ncbi:MAG: DUF885 domain-containing protein [Deltaproteobacteria bacterium]|nr:DUF885 domain-containing protein [Deltaproteobacteria bacterium]
MMTRNSFRGNHSSLLSPTAWASPSGCLILALASLVAACTAPPSAPSSAASSAAQGNESLHQFFEQVFQDRLALSPMLQTQLGLGEQHGSWDDFSDQAGHKSAAMAKRHLGTLQQEFDPADLRPPDRLSYRLLQRELEMEIEGEQWLYHNYPVNQEHGWQAGLPAFLINTHTVDSVEDARAYIQRLKGLSTAVDQIIGAMKIRTKRGIVPPKFVFPQVYRDIDNLLAGEPFPSTPGAQESPLWADIQTKVSDLELPASEQSALLSEARQALIDQVGPAFEALRLAAQEQEGHATEEDGVWKLPQGEEYYQFTLRQYTTTAMTPEEIHQLGLAEVARIHSDLHGIMSQVGFDGSLQDFFEFTRTDPQFYLVNTEENRLEYLRLTQEAIDGIQAGLEDFFLTQPKARLVLKRVEAFREASAGIAFYQSADLDGSRPAIYYTNLHEMSERPTFNIETIAYHEAIPGHHMQVSIAQELENVPMFRRLAFITAFDEGWGLYAERLGKDMGGFEDPYSDFGRLTQELWRACRLVVDSGIHSQRWTRQQVIDYHLANTPSSLGEIVKETERYIVLPGQATSYKVGMAKILQLRAQARQRLGDRFDIREFHDVVLTHGSVPLDILAENVETWTAAVLAASVLAES